MIDIHTHLYFPDYDADREKVIGLAFESGITMMVSVGTSPEDNMQALAIARLDERIYASVGLHPHFFQNQESRIMNQADEEGTLKNLRNDLTKLIVANRDKVVAIGEAGLDYFLPRRQAGSRTPEPISEEQRARQKEGLMMQMELAQELELPMILHCRPARNASAVADAGGDAYEDLYEILKDFVIRNSQLVIRKIPKEQDTRMRDQVTDYKLPARNATHSVAGGPVTYFILHCYMADTEMTKKFLTLPNVYFSFTGNITYLVKKILAGTKDDLHETVKMIPLERMLTETDCPFLAPQKYRGKRNEPQFVAEVVKAIAAYKKIAPESVAEQTTHNAEKLFFRKPAHSVS